MNRNIEEFYGKVPIGADKGRISDELLAEEMAYADKPFQDVRVESGNEAMDELFMESEDYISPYEMRMPIQEIMGERVYDKYLGHKQSLAAKAIQGNRSWAAVNKPASAGLPTLGKR
jgi:hypothetical protein